ncbi:hypothetical protein BDY24DRAFT_379544 [Mrakia frigida]|uniref:uncharacterized protein n=1 Tax=Mrakia frigida TaxID=29902 RepID=UPI003FCBEF78
MVMVIFEDCRLLPPLCLLCCSSRSSPQGIYSSRFVSLRVPVGFPCQSRPRIPMDLYICLGIAAYSEHILSPMALSVSFAGVGGRGKKERGDASSASSHFPSFLLSLRLSVPERKECEEERNGLIESLKKIVKEGN